WSLTCINFFLIEWVDVTNDLLMKCHINLHVTKLTECGANVFVGLYESILGEKVPDFIASPRSQEDDAHNVQAVIDSLALDYLQVSLSHITGEYLHSWREHCERRERIYPKSVEGSESTSELIRLGDTAHSFSLRNEGSMDSVNSTEFLKENLSSSAKKLGEPIRPAIPLQPPYQPPEPRPHYSMGREYQSSARQSLSFANSHGLEASVVIKDNDLLPLLLEEFPYLHISQHSMNKMWQQQLAQMEQLKSASGKDRSRLKLQSEVEEALKKHDLLVDIIKKDQNHHKRLQEFKQRIYRQKFAQNKMREKRQQIARAKKYYEDYRVQLRAKMMRARTREERIFKNLFEEGLEIQKQRLQELRMYSKEKRAEQRRVHQNELESMENYYKDQFSMLAEAVSQEHQEIQAREKAQAKTLHKTKRELRSKMEKEIQHLQTLITQNDDDSFFRELEAERLKSRLQMASFQYSKSYFL
uniref:Centrosomal protein 95 n=1 Tax=Chelonoidis abingdonii TaxID=106734 RepID=A0A8C0GAT4_CHEAB